METARGESTPLATAELIKRRVRMMRKGKSIIWTALDEKTDFICVKVSYKVVNMKETKNEEILDWNFVGSSFCVIIT